MSDNSRVYEIAEGGINAKMKIDGDKYIVLKGSIINPQVRGKVEGRSTKITQLVKKGVLEEKNIDNVKENPHFLLNEDVSFENETKASNFVLGHNSKGTLQWKCEGKSFRELEIVASDDNFKPTTSMNQVEIDELIQAIKDGKVDMYTKLVEASKEGHTEVVKILLENGAIAKENIGAFIWASVGGHIDVVRLFLENGASAKSMDNHTYTVLRGASSRGHTEIVKLLLEHGAAASINVKGDWGITAII